MDKSTEFSVMGYKLLVTQFLDANYRFCDFTQKSSDERVVIFRHDIDFSTQAARDLANLEAELGITSTYFFLIRSPFYNIYEPATLSHIREINSLGHNIGLHFDASLYDNSFTCLDYAANKECEILEKIVGLSPEFISFHRPTKSLLGLDKKVGGRDHSYNTRFFRDFGYVSDSRGEWRFGPPDKHQAFADGKGMQVLTHPIWWMTEGQTASKKITNFIAERVRQVSQNVKTNCNVQFNEDPDA